MSTFFVITFKMRFYHTLPYLRHVTFVGKMKKENLHFNSKAVADRVAVKSSYAKISVVYMMLNEGKSVQVYMCFTVQVNYSPRHTFVCARRFTGRLYLHVYVPSFFRSNRCSSTPTRHCMRGTPQISWQIKPLHPHLEIDLEK